MKIGFVMVVVGLVIGLGVIWKFFYVVGINGGGVFFFIFVLFIIFLGYLFLVGEFIFGRWN